LPYVLEAQGFVGAGCVSYNATGGGRPPGHLRSYALFSSR
jgi:hypothetical protein